MKNNKGQTTLPTNGTPSTNSNAPIHVITTFAIPITIAKITGASAL